MAMWWEKLVIHDLNLNTTDIPWCSVGTYVASRQYVLERVQSMPTVE